MAVHNNRAGFLLQSASAEGVSGNTITANYANYALLYYQGTPGNKGESATFNLQASPEGSLWTTVGTYTATGTSSATAQIAGLLPYVRAVTVKVYTATAGAGTATGAVSVYYAPGLM